MTLEAVTQRAQRVRNLERASPLTVARAELVEAMREAHQAGQSMRAIAEAAGVSHQRVSQLLNAEHESKEKRT